MDVSDPTLAQQENESLPPDIDPVSPAEPKPAAISRAEIDTSAPFESVKEAATRFGGFGFWRPASLKPSSSPSFQEFDAAKMEEEAAQLEMDLAAKETETLNVLKELETTKVILEELKLKLQEGGNNGESPALSEPEQAKHNLGNELAGARAAIETCKEKIEEERLLLEETGQRLASNSLKASFLEEELKETKMKLAAARRMKRAEEELRESKKALEEVASRVEVAEEVLRRRRRHYYYSSSLASTTLSIGQILRRKLQEAEEIERKKTKRRNGKRKVSLGQLLRSTRLKDSFYNDDNKQSPAKKKRFGGFSGISLLLAEQSEMMKKKKRQISAAGFRCRDV